MRPPSALPPPLGAGPFAVAEAVRHHGVTERRLSGSDLRRPFHGVRASTLVSSVEEQCAAAATRMHDGQYFSHMTAARLWNIPLAVPFEPHEKVHVSARRPVRAPAFRGVAGHECTDPHVSVSQWKGFAVGDPLSTWCQLARFLTFDDLVAAADAIVTSRKHAPALATLDELRTRAGRYHGWGTAAMVRALPSVRQGAESPTETHLRLMMQRGGLPEPELNVNLYDERGEFLGRGDLVYRRWRVLVEYDGDHHRTDVRHYERDQRRVQGLEDAGWIVVRVRARGLYVMPQESVRRIRQALARHGGPSAREGS
jgi:hypothetical protein